jgi:hypothetical protein
MSFIASLIPRLATIVKGPMKALAGTALMGVIGNVINPGIQKATEWLKTKAEKHLPEFLKPIAMQGIDYVRGMVEDRVERIANEPLQKYRKDNNYARAQPAVQRAEVTRDDFIGTGPDGGFLQPY